MFCQCKMHEAASELHFGSVIFNDYRDNSQTKNNLTAFKI